MGDYFRSILTNDDCSSMKLITRTRISAVDFTNTYIRKQFILIQTITLAYISFICNIESIKKQETAYHTYFVHHLCTAITNYIDYSIIFYPGETPLNSMSRYLKSKNIIESECEAYKADGISSYNNIELFVNEISGPFANTHQNKLKFDLHKAMYGYTSML